MLLKIVKVGECGGPFLDNNLYWGRTLSFFWEETLNFIDQKKLKKWLKIIQRFSEPLMQEYISN